MTDLPMDILSKLMLTRELNFGGGRIMLFGNRMVLPPASIFSEHIKLTNNSQIGASLLYEAARVSFRDGIGKGVGQKFKFSVNDFFKWMPNIGSIAGWGKITVAEFIAKKNYGVVYMQDSPIVADLKGIILKGPVDHVMAGFIAGAAEATLRSTVQATEESCAIDGGTQCKFVFKMTEKAAPAAKV